MSEDDYTADVDPNSMDSNPYSNGDGEGGGGSGTDSNSMADAPRVTDQAALNKLRGNFDDSSGSAMHFSHDDGPTPRFQQTGGPSSGGPFPVSGMGLPHQRPPGPPFGTPASEGGPFPRFGGPRGPPPDMRFPGPTDGPRPSFPGAHDDKIGLLGLAPNGSEPPRFAGHPGPDGDPRFGGSGNEPPRFAMNPDSPRFGGHQGPSGSFSPRPMGSEPRFGGPDHSFNGPPPPGPGGDPRFMGPPPSQGMDLARSPRPQGGPPERRFMSPPTDGGFDGAPRFPPPGGNEQSFSQPGLQQGIEQQPGFGGGDGAPPEGFQQAPFRPGLPPFHDFSISPIF